MNITPLDIDNQKFRKRFRGFDVREVDDFLQSVAEDILDVMRVEADKLDEEIKHLKKTKKQLETYFESFLRFNIELLDTWNKRET